MAKFETIEVSETEISCDGGKGALGHPKVYLYIPKDKGSIVCPYCSKNFVLAKN
ncbi:MAG TPA: zinc-finger domain-containing protein [Alphaproteobacteria bacterium]|nr:zinc-finger domain-containing protein [Alphaproteobacteria bacterium]